MCSQALGPIGACMPRSGPCPLRGGLCSVARGSSLRLRVYNSPHSCVLTEIRAQRMARPGGGIKAQRRRSTAAKDRVFALWWPCMPVTAGGRRVMIVTV